MPLNRTTSSFFAACGVLFAQEQASRAEDSPTRETREDGLSGRIQFVARGAFAKDDVSWDFPRP